MRFPTTPTDPCGHSDAPAKAVHEDTPVYLGWTVKKAWAGAHQVVRGEFQCEVPTWQVEIVRSRAAADRIVAATEAIDRHLVGIDQRHCRLRINVRPDGGLDVSDYDAGRFSFSVAPEEIGR